MLTGLTIVSFVFSLYFIILNQDTNSFSCGQVLPVQVHNKCVLTATKKIPFSCICSSIVPKWKSIIFAVKLLQSRPPPVPNLS